MQTIILCLLFIQSYIFSQDSNITIFRAPQSTQVPYSAYAIADVQGNYEDYYYGYKNNTKNLEDGDYFSKKNTIQETNTSAIYRLIFKHWLIGEIFQIQEDHKKITQAQWTVISMDRKFQGKLQADMWWIDKQLLPETKSSLVGDRFKLLKVQICFINLSPNQTRLYYYMQIDAEDKRTQKAVNEEVKDGINNIIKYKQNN